MSDKLPTHAIEFRGAEFRQVVCDQSGNGAHVYGQWRPGSVILNELFDYLLRGSHMTEADARTAIGSIENYTLGHWRERK